MSRKKYLSKKGKGIITGLTIGLVGMACIGAVGAMSHGFKDWDYKNWLTEKANLVELDFRTDKATSVLTSSELGQVLNDSVKGKKVIFGDVTNVSTIYQANGGLKFGSSNVNGYFVVDLKDYQFDHIRITTKAFSSFNEGTNTYTCDYASISVNEKTAIDLSNNKSNTSKDVKTDVIQFDFEENQTNLKIAVSKRAIIYSMEMWDDKANNEDESKDNSTTLKVGTFVFNDKLTTDKTLSQSVLETFVDFKSNGVDYYKIKLWQQNGTISMYYQSKTEISTGVYQVLVYTGSNATWANNAYKTIQITNSVALTSEFYDLITSFGSYK